jgi:hypothetical protein
MTDDSGIPPLAAQLMQSMVLLHATHKFYQTIFIDLNQSTDPNGSPDLPELFRQLNLVLTGFAPRDIEIRTLLSRFEN